MILRRDVFSMLSMLLVVCCYFNDVAAQQKLEYSAKVVSVATDISAPKIEATAWVLMEMNSGWIVSSNNPDQPLPPASITKLMSNYVVYEKLVSGDITLDDQVSISEEAWRAEGSRMFANVNSKVELRHLLKSTVIQSGNDAAIALAEHIGGTESVFASLMNKAARELGLKNSHFMNSTGLPDDGHSMSASDIAVLSAAIIREFPEYYSWYAEKSYTHNDITQYNRNKLLWKDNSVDGLKTGHTEAAGYCLVGSAIRSHQRWIAVVLGSQSQEVREAQVHSLLNYGFTAYEPQSVLDQQGGVASADVYFGDDSQIRLQTPYPVSIVVPKGRGDDIQVDLRVSPYYEAPIEVGQSVGVASILLDGNLLTDIPLVAMSSIEKGGLWRQAKDSVRLWLRNLFSD
ncbi:MAG: D-alanyl-D-alanine carboxypeptidase [Acidiferrobacterales bacterium]|nr:D-alanyl-D-alanine carboxypeptidase [Acidiferrobacterales bacterium]